jgi:hypothetical protein
MFGKKLAHKLNGMNITITCKKAVDYISKKEEGKLSLWQRVQLWRHLAICGLCRRFAEQNDTIKAMFQMPGHHHHLTDDEKKKIAEAVFGEQK